MSTKTMTTRRAFLAGAAYAAAALPPGAAHVAAAAPAGAALDSIFPALAAHARVWSEVEASIAAMGLLEDALGDDGADHTRLVLSDGLHALSHEDIDRIATDWHWRPKKRLQKHAEFDTETARLAGIQQVSGLTAARAREKVAWDGWKRQMYATAATVPSSAPGVAAFVSFMRDEIFCERGSPGEDIENHAWRSLSEATNRLARIDATRLG